MSETMLEVRDLCVSFPVDGKRTLEAVSHVDLAISRGETLGLVGESGCGKTTLGRAVKGIVRPSGGTILYRGQDIARMNASDRKRYQKEAQMIFQDPYSSLDPRMTVREIVKEGMKAHRMGSAAELNARVDSMLELVGLSPEHANRFPHEFSGGQRQRIGIARALALDPAFIVCDEPTSALDVSIQAQIITLLKEIQKRMGLTLLFISHDLAMVKYVSDRIAVMYLGEIIELADADELYDHPQHPYTRALLSSIQLADPDAEARRQRIRLEGDVPNPLDLPEGCRFQSRCPHASKACRSKKHALAAVSPTHFTSCSVGAEPI